MVINNHIQVHTQKMGWSALGFTRTDAKAILAPALGRMFCLTKQDVLWCL